MIHPVPPLHEGRFAIVTNVNGGMRWTHWLRARTDARADERSWCGRRNRVVLASRRWGQVVRWRAARWREQESPVPGESTYKP